MSDNFDYRQWMLDNRMGPYSKDPLKKGKLNESIEEEAIEEAPMPPAPEDVYDSSEEDEYDRGWDLAGPQIKSAIDNLRSSGYGDEDIMNFFRTALENYDQAFSGFNEEQGIEEDEDAQLNEYEITCVERGGKYYKINDEDEVVSGPYMDSDCTRSISSGASSHSRPSSGYGSKLKPAYGDFIVQKQDGSESTSFKVKGVKGQTDSAYLIRVMGPISFGGGGFREIFVPKSMVKDMSTGTGNRVYAIPASFVAQKFKGR